MLKFVYDEKEYVLEKDKKEIRYCINIGKIECLSLTIRTFNPDSRYI